jgi:hypothetical protein
VVAATLVSLFLLAVFTVVYEVRMYGNAKALSDRIDSGGITLDQGMTEYQALAKHTLF